MDLNLGKVPVLVTMTAADCQTVMNALVDYKPDPLEIPRVPLLVRHLRHMSEDAIQKFAAGGVPGVTDDEPGGFRADDPDTSRQGAFDAMPRTGTQRLHALHAVARAGSGGMTWAEVEIASRVNNAWKRLSELKQGGWIEVVGERVVQHTGSMASVYVLAPKARIALGLPATDEELF